MSCQDEYDAAVQAQSQADASYATYVQEDQEAQAAFSQYMVDDSAAMMAWDAYFMCQSGTGPMTLDNVAEEVAHLRMMQDQMKKLQGEIAEKRQLVARLQKERMPKK